MPSLNVFTFTGLSLVMGAVFYFFSRRMLGKTILPTDTVWMAVGICCMAVLGGLGASFLDDSFSVSALLLLVELFAFVLVLCYQFYHYVWKTVRKFQEKLQIIQHPDCVYQSDNPRSMLDSFLTNATVGDIQWLLIDGAWGACWMRVTDMWVGEQIRQEIELRLG